MNKANLSLQLIDNDDQESQNNQSFQLINSNLALHLEKVQNDNRSVKYYLENNYNEQKTIETFDIRKVFGTFTAVDGVSFAVYEKEIFW